MLIQIRWGLFTLLATIFLGVTAYADQTILDQTGHVMVVEPQLPSGKKAKIIVKEFSDLSHAQLNNLVSDDRLKNINTIVTTENPELIKATALSHIKTKSKKLIRFLPLGKITKVKNWSKSQFNIYKDSVRRNYETDKIGITVVTVVYGVEQVILFMDPNYNLYETGALTFINTLFTGLFSLDRDMFMRIIDSPRSKLFEKFDKILAPKKLISAKTMLSQYLASFGLNSILNLVRYSSLSVDGISTFDGHMVTKDTVALPSLSTAAAFSWAGLNEEARKKGHQSRIILRRLSDFRSFIMISLASTSAVYSANSLFSTPVITFVVSTSLGLVLYWNANRILNWTQNNPKATKIYQWNQSLEKFLNKIITAKPKTKIRDLDLRKPDVVRSCQALFAS